MTTCEVGDDVLGDDPTVIELEKQTAELLNKEAGLFVPSGTMSNLIAIMVHCRERGSEIILGEDSHINLYEQGGIATVGHVHSRTVPNAADGTMDLAHAERLIRTTNVHFPITKLLCIENTQNYCGGRVLSIEYTNKCAELCKKHNLKFHIDGARLWNAAVALQVPESKLVEGADTVSVCFSKGLGAPVGSVLVGPRAFIEEARRIRKVLGGGMRQAGVLAACGIVALKSMRARLVEDHQRAKKIAVALGVLPALQLDVDSVETNIIFFNIDGTKTTHTAASLVQALGKNHNVLVMALGPMRVRICVHYMVTDEDTDRCIKAVSEELSK